ncbi:hypothetical protein ABGB18_47065 [Nonomuraea sp. B12E4]|uniref:hypothetical protein n=1 Tax=Nonomuraea sp. B12E4 TaxID=3153564 RepID=UPI00325EF810
MRRLATTATVAALAVGSSLAVAAPASAAQGWVQLWSHNDDVAALVNPAEGCHPIHPAERAYNNTDSLVVLFPLADCQGAPVHMPPGDVRWLPFAATSIYVTS